MRNWALVAAFLAGLAPGLLLYWRSSKPAPAPAAAPVAAAPANPGPAIAPPEPPAVKPPKTIVKEVRIPGDAELPKLLAERSEKLAAAETALDEVRTRLREAEARLTQAQTEHTKLASAEAELRQQAAAAAQQSAGFQNEARAREARLAELDAANQRLQRQLAEAQRARPPASSPELEEIARRRETYLNSILTRYREATELFRALSLRLDNPRDGSSPLSNDLSRIQQAIFAADEDLRQLRALNAQAARLQSEANSRRR
jgi:chromosome segregation ATPase